MVVSCYMAPWAEGNMHGALAASMGMENAGRTEGGGCLSQLAQGACLEPPRIAVAGPARARAAASGTPFFRPPGIFKIRPRQRAGDLCSRVSDQDWSRQLASSLTARVDASIVPRMPQIDMSEEQQSLFTAMAHSLLAADLSSEREPG